MGQRLQLHQLLEAIPGVEQAYFQAPASSLMVYPCIVYGINDIDTEYAGNSPYKLATRYQITVMDKNPDSEIPKQVALLPTSKFDRRFVVNNLNHTVFNLYF